MSTVVGTSVVVAVLVGLIVASRSWRTSERVDRIEVRGARLLGVEEIIAQAQVAPRMHVDAVDLADVRRRLIAHPLIRRASVVRDHNAIRLEITERTPVARLSVAGRIRLVDGDGVLLPERDMRASLDLPVLSGVSTTAAGVDSSALTDALSILREADERNAMSDLISAVRRVEDGTFWVETTDDAVPVRVGAPIDVARKFELLQAFMKNSLRPHTRQLRHAQYVDLRFHDQVVVRWSDPVIVQ